MRKSRSKVVSLAVLVALPIASCHGTTDRQLQPTSPARPSAAMSVSGTGVTASASPSVSGRAPNSASAISSAGITSVPPPLSAPPVPLPTVLASYAGKDLLRLPTSQHVVALTFDAGANADAIPEILATLHAENVPATFFLTGAWVKAFPVQARLVGARYPVGNHSSTHPNLPQLSSATVRTQITDAQAAITAAAGRDPQPLFRFPFGDRDPRTEQIVNSLGYISVLWTVDTLGWQGTSGGQSTGSVTRRVLARLQPGEIVLMHVGSNPTDHSTLDGDSLKNTIEQIKAAGYRVSTIPAGLNLG